MKKCFLAGLLSFALAASLLEACSGSDGAGGQAGTDGSADGAGSGFDASPPGDAQGADSSSKGMDAGTDSPLPSNPDASDAATTKEDAGDATTDAGKTPDAGDGGIPVDASDDATALDASDAAIPLDASDAASTLDASDAAPLIDASDAATLIDASDAATAIDANVPDSSTADAASAETVLLLGTSSSQLLQGQFSPGAAWTTTTASGGSPFPPSLTADTTGRGVAVYTSSTGGIVSATIWNNGTWSAPSATNASAVARAQPFVDATGGTTTHLLYQDSSYHFAYLAYTGSWSSAPQAVGPAADQAYGPVPAAIAALGANATAAFIDGESPLTNYAAAIDLAGGTWQARADIAGPESFTISPAIIPLRAGPELMMVFVRQDNQIVFVQRTAGTWSNPALVNNALTNNGVALAPLPSGGAILAFQGQDTKLYWSEYTSGSWSPVAPLASPNVSITGSPALAHGIGGDTAEIAYVSSGAAYHARLAGGTWGAPVLVGGAGLNGVAIASVP